MFFIGADNAEAVDTLEIDERKVAREARGD